MFLKDKSSFGKVAAFLHPDPSQKRSQSMQAVLIYDKLVSGSEAEWAGPKP